MRPIKSSGNSSVGRAQPCQGWGREFESRFPLQIASRKQPFITAAVFVSALDYDGEFLRSSTLPLPPVVAFSVGLCSAMLLANDTARLFDASAKQRVSQSPVEGLFQSIVKSVDGIFCRALPAICAAMDLPCQDSSARVAAED
jgi:hypothetical protein